MRAVEEDEVAIYALSVCCGCGLRRDARLSS